MTDSSAPQVEFSASAPEPHILSINHKHRTGPRAKPTNTPVSTERAQELAQGIEGTFHIFRTWVHFEWIDDQGGRNTLEVARA